MTRARYVTPRQTTARIENLRNLVSALINGELERDEIGQVLQVGPSGIRKYLAELGDKLEVSRYTDPAPGFKGFPVYRLSISPDAAREYLDSLAAAESRPRNESTSAIAIAARNPARHFHIMRDDTHFSVRICRTPPMRDPMVAAFFGAGRHEVRHAG
jgi:hypothetical protein